eukprot:TRINITY_DN12236_c0_g1_i2.p1 TRINITY_DN12236_c0_g1~~TRINITY_DN12236_c0_g1_i2.p1  ORF type:complete len:305 (+),score=34.22 TRINITY_DN12236_c0_g1_i2:83-997(+)
MAFWPAQKVPMPKQSGCDAIVLPTASLPSIATQPQQPVNLDPSFITTALQHFKMKQSPTSTLVFVPTLPTENTPSVPIAKSSPILFQSPAGSPDQVNPFGSSPNKTLEPQPTFSFPALSTPLTSFSPQSFGFSPSSVSPAIPPATGTPIVFGLSPPPPIFGAPPQSEAAEQQLSPSPSSVSPIVFGNSSSGSAKSPLKGKSRRHHHAHHYSAHASPSPTLAFEKPALSLPVMLDFFMKQCLMGVKQAHDVMSAYWFDDMLRQQDDIVKYFLWHQRYSFVSGTDIFKSLKTKFHVLNFCYVTVFH